MSCEKQTSGSDSDSLEVKAGVRPFDKSATAWLLGQAVRHAATVPTRESSKTAAWWKVFAFAVVSCRKP